MSKNPKIDMLVNNELYEIYPLPDIYQLSKSKIDLFYDCYWKFFFRYLTNYPVTPTVWPATLFGETIHEILEFVVASMKSQQTSSFILKSIKPMFKDIFDRKLIEKADSFKKSRAYKYENMIEDGEKYAKLLASFVIGYFKEFHDLISEVSFEQLVFPNVKFTGFADLVVFNSADNYSIIDFKTTKDSYKYYVVDWKKDLQSNIYLYLGKNMFSNLYAKRFSYLVMNYEVDQLFLKSNTIKENQLEDIHYLNLLKTYSNPILDFYINFREKKFQTTSANKNKCHWCVYKNICKFNKSKEY